MCLNICSNVGQRPEFQNRMRRSANPALPAPLALVWPTLPSTRNRYLDATGNDRALRPWQQLPELRPTEPCVITEISYEILRDGVFRTAAKYVMYRSAS